jgi:hypothetical protein
MAEHLTERQKKWFASVEEGLQRDTGRSLGEWVAIARTCPEATPRKRQQWLRENHGLGVNRASTVLSHAFPSDSSWAEPDGLRAALWSDPAAAVILERLTDAITVFSDVTVGQRKGYTAFSRDVQFAAARPLKHGRALLGLKLPVEASARLGSPSRKESWSERLTAVVELGSPAEIDDELGRLIEAAYEAG